MNSAAQKIDTDTTPAELAIQTRDLNLWYGTFQALYDINLDIKEGIITSLIGPSGCGKSTFLRSANRINERLGYVRIEGSIEVGGQNIYDPACELVQVRKQVGMVFQRPNPLPISIRENILAIGRDHVEEASGVLRIGTTHTQARYALPSVISEFRSSYPEVTLHMNQGTPAQIAELAANANDETGQVILSLTVDPGHFGGFSADQCCAGLSATFRACCRRPAMR